MADQKSIEVNVNVATCAGHGRCCSEAPTVFGYDEVDNKAYILDHADISAHVDEVRSAAAACPEAAIIVRS